MQDNIGSLTAASLLVAALLGSCSKDPQVDPDAGIEPDAASDLASASDLQVIFDAGTDVSTGDARADLAPPADATADMGPSNIVPATSGTRLRRMLLRAGPGAEMTVGFWDTTLEIACMFQETGDGEYRCLPTPQSQLSFAAFADANCTQPVSVTPSTCIDGWSLDHNTNTFYRPTSTPAALAGNVYYSPNCLATTVELDKQYFVGEPVAPTEFVGGTLQTEQRSDTMISNYVVGEDGSRVLLETLHATLGYRCDFEGTDRCDPGTAFRTTKLYADAACTQPVVAYQDPPPLVTVATTSQRQCARLLHHYERGPQVQVSMVYTDALGGCAPTIVDSTATYYALGAEILPTDLPAATLQTDGGGDLLARRWVDAEGRALSVVHDFWDVAADQPCDPARLSTQEDPVCLARDVGEISLSFFQNPTCTDPAGVSHCRNEVPSLLKETVQGQACAIPALPRTIALYEVGPALTDVYENLSPLCSAVSSPSFTAFEIGNPAGSSLPTFTVEIE